MFNLCNRQLTEQNVHSHQQLCALLLYIKIFVFCLELCKKDNIYNALSFDNINLKK